MSDIEKAETVSANHPPPRTVTPVAAPSRRALGNPGPLGLFSFASTTLILSLYNAGARGISVPNAVVGMALFCGGLAQLLAGMWEFAAGNTFGATAFTSYGAFWGSYATILIPGSGIGAAYEAATTEQEPSALGIYLITWMIVTFFFLIAALRKNIAFVALFFFLTITFLLLGAAEFTGHLSVQKAGGVVGVITAFIAYYAGMCELLGPQDAFTLPLGTGIAKRYN
ncbi:Gpr1 family protein [Dentipellis sp. KUC8613]|nr:Gpr1 family protein [Dentipellis sp. KUC8613]